LLFSILERKETNRWIRIRSPSVTDRQEKSCFKTRRICKLNYRHQLYHIKIVFYCLWFS